MVTEERLKRREMSKVIQFPNKTRARIKDGKLHAPEGYHASDDDDRTERIRRSLEKINNLMKELKDEG